MSLFNYLSPPGYDWRHEGRLWIFGKVLTEEECRRHHESFIRNTAFVPMYQVTDEMIAYAFDPAMLIRMVLEECNVA